MKYNLRKLYIASMIAILLATTLINMTGDQFPILKSGISPAPEIMKVPMKLYFIDVENGLTYPENRTVTIHNNQLVKGIVEALIAGPKNKKLVSPIDPSVHIEASKIDNRICNLKFSGSFIDNPTWQDNDKDLIIGALVNTLTELEQIQVVNILVDGKPVAGTRTEKVSKGPYRRNEAIIYSTKSQPIEVVMEFIDSIQNERYDIAYELIDFKTKTEIPYDAFTKMMSTLNQKYQRYERKVLFTQKFSNTLKVYIRYEAEMSGFAQPQVGFSEYWEVVEEDRSYKVLLKSAELKWE